MDNQVDWSIFDIDPNDSSQDVSRSQLVNEFQKFNGTPREFALELDKRFGWSGMMCAIAEQWCANV